MISRCYAWHRNLRWYYAYCVCSSFLFTRGVFLVYLGRKGLSLTEVALYQTMFGIAVVLFEVPTGYFGDRYGRRLSLQVGTVLLVAHSVGMILFVLPGQFLILAVIEAFAYTFISGTEQAFFYELLDKYNERSNYLRINSRLLALRSVITAVAIFIGSLIAKVSWELLYIAMILVYLIQLFCLMRIYFNGHTTEIKVRSTTKRGHQFLAQAIIYRPVIVFVGFLVVFGALDGFYMSYYSSNQMIFEKIGVDISLTGFFLGASYFISSISYTGAEVVARYVGRRKALIFLIMVECLLFAGLSICIECGVMFFAVSMLATLIPEGVFVIAESVIQDNVRNECRSTILSAVSVFRSVVSAAVFPLIGYFLDSASVRDALGILAMPIGFLTLMAVVGLVVVRRYRVS